MHKSRIKLVDGVHTSGTAIRDRRRQELRRYGVLVESSPGPRQENLRVTVATLIGCGPQARHFLGGRLGIRGEDTRVALGSVTLRVESTGTLGDRDLPRLRDGALIPAHSIDLVIGWVVGCPQAFPGSRRRHRLSHRIL